MMDEPRLHMALHGRPDSGRWYPVLASVVLLHVLLLGMVEITPPPVVRTSDAISLVFNLVEAEQKKNEEREPETKRLKEAQPPKPQLPQPEKQDTKPKDTRPQEAKPKETNLPKPEAKKETPKEQKSSAPIDNSGLQFLRPSVAFDTAKAAEKAPVNAPYLSDKNTEAADHGPKDLPRGDPFMNGESAEIRYAGRRGETQENVRDEDAASGSVAKQGTPESAAPELAPKRENGPRDKGIDAQKTEIDASKKALQTTRSREQPMGRHPDPLGGPESQGKQASKGGKITSITEGPDGFTPSAKDLADSSGEGLAANKSSDKRERDPAWSDDTHPKNLFSEKPKPVPQTSPSDQTEPVPENTRTDDPVDPELKRLANLLNQTNEKPKDQLRKEAIDGDLGRDGKLGHEGSGKRRRGEIEAVSDTVTLNLHTSAAESGDPAFATKADPVTKYLKSFFQRIDAKWKANISAQTKTRIEVGVVAISFTVSPNGTLIDIQETERNGDVTDESVVDCKNAVRLAAPLAPFPEDLKDQDQLSKTVRFLYR